MKNKQWVERTFACSRWLALTVLYAYLAPWLLLALLILLFSLVPSQAGSIREIVTAMATTNSEAWQREAEIWRNITFSCFIAVVCARAVTSAVTSPVVDSLTQRATESVASWIHSRVPDLRLKQIRNVAFGAVIAGCVALSILAARTHNRPPDRSPDPNLSPNSAPSAAALTLSTGRVVSGEATISTSASGAYIVQFTQQRKAATK